MITVHLTVVDGCLSELRVCGHALRSTYRVSVVCAAVTALVRSAADAAVTHQPPGPDGFDVSGAAPEPGVLVLRVGNPDADADWLRGLTDVLLAGLSRTAREAPNEVDLIMNATRGEQHGS